MKSSDRCSVTKSLEIIPAGIDEYRQLKRFHYRGGDIIAFSAVYALKETHPVRGRFADICGVIVYSMPTANLQLRNIATGGMFEGFTDRSLKLAMVNKNIRTISRVIIEPRYRGLGLAQRLVKETMPKLNVPIIEPVAVMGNVNPFFEKAGMKAYHGKTLPRCVKLIGAFGMVGIDEAELIEPQKIQHKINSLNPAEADFIEYQINAFLQAYGKRRLMPPGIERTRYVISKLTSRPVYYIWHRGSKK